MDYICKNKDFNHKNGTCDECQPVPPKGHFKVGKVETYPSIHKENWEKELDKEINQFLDQPYFTQEWEKVYHKLRLNLKSFIRTEIEKAKHSQLKEIREWAKEKQDGIEYEIKMANDKSVKSHFSGQHKAFSDLLKELEK